MKITETSLLKMDPGEKRERYFRDEKLTGYCVRARRLADGSVKRTFLVMFQQRQYESGIGVRKTIKAFIGDWRDPWTEFEARAEARRLLNMRERGERVVSAKAQAKRERLMTDLIAEFRREYIPSLKPATRLEYDRLLTRHVAPRIGKLSVSEVSRQDVRELHKSMAATPYQANRVLAVVRKMYSYAIEHEWRTDNPASRITKYTEKRRDVWLNENELPKLVSELNKRGNSHAELLKFLVVTGWRINEAIRLRWDMVDLQRQVARLPDTKTGQQTRVLSADASRLLERLPHRCGFCFSGRGGGGMAPVSYKKIRELLAEICETADITVISPHALRHTAATFAAMAGATLFELKEAFGWKSVTMPGRYVEAAESLGRSGAQKTANAVNIFERPSTAGPMNFPGSGKAQ